MVREGEGKEEMKGRRGYEAKERKGKMELRVVKLRPRVGLLCLRLMMASTFAALINAQEFADGYRSDFKLGENTRFFWIA